MEIKGTSGLAGLHQQEQKRLRPHNSKSTKRAGWMPGRGKQMAHQATFSLGVLLRLIGLRFVCGDTEGFQNSTVKLLVRWRWRTRKAEPSGCRLRFCTSAWGGRIRRRRSCQELILLQIVIWGRRRSGDSSWNWDQWAGRCINLYWKQQQFCSKAVWTP